MDNENETHTRTPNTMNTSGPNQPNEQPRTSTDASSMPEDWFQSMEVLLFDDMPPETRNRLLQCARRIIQKDPTMGRDVSDLLVVLIESHRSVKTAAYEHLSTRLFDSFTTHHNIFKEVKDMRKELDERLDNWKPELEATCAKQLEDMKESTLAEIEERVEFIRNSSLDKYEDAAKKAPEMIRQHEAEVDKLKNQSKLYAKKIEQASKDADAHLIENSPTLKDVKGRLDAFGEHFKNIKERLDTAEEHINRLATSVANALKKIQKVFLIGVWQAKRVCNWAVSIESLVQSATHLQGRDQNLLQGRLSVTEECQKLARSGFHHHRAWNDLFPKLQKNAIEEWEKALKGEAEVPNKDASIVFTAEMKEELPEAGDGGVAHSAPN